MHLLRKKLRKFPLGIWIALVALILCLMAWVMQAYSLLNWERAVDLGLQNHSLSGAPTDQAWALKERGEAIADLIWPLPVAIIALIGLLNGKFYGFVASMMEFAVCIYFPLFYLFQVWGSNPETVVAALLLWAVPSLMGIIGLWVNRSYFIKPLTS